MRQMCVIGDFNTNSSKQAVYPNVQLYLSESSVPLPQLHKFLSKNIIESLNFLPVNSTVFFFVCFLFFENCIIIVNLERN